MPKFEFYLSKIVKYGLYAILLTPLIFWPKALYAFLTPKFLLFQILVEIVFVAWLILQMIGSGNQSCLRRNYIAVAIVGFLAVSFISALAGIDFQRSVWGIGARMTGLFVEFHFLAWFLVLASVLRSGSTRIVPSPSIPGILPSPRQGGANSSIPGIRNHLRELVENPHISASTYLNFSFAVSILVALTAFYQNTQWHLVPGYTIFSNPTFVAPYFLFHFFWGFYQTFTPNVRNRVSNIKPWFFAVGSTFILIALFLGEIRGAVIGLMAGILFLGIGLILSNVLNRRKRIILATSYLLLLLGIIFFWQWRNTPFIQSVGILKKFSEISTSAATIQTRFLTWQTAFKGLYDKPLLGVGPENFNYLFNAHYNPRLLMYGGSSFAETWQDKPHNAFIEILTETGIIGSLAYISIWVFVVFYLFRIFRRSEKFLSFALAGAFISYLGAVFFSFDSFGSWFGLYLMLGFLASHGNSLIPRIEESPIGGGRILGISRKFALFVIGIAIFVVFLMYVNYLIWRANLADADAIRYFGRDSSMGVALFNKSLNYSTPYKSEYQFDLIASVSGAIEKGIPINNLEDTVNFALNEADKAVLAHPNNAGSYTDMLRIYNILGTRGRDPEILNQAEIFGKKSLELSPNRQETLFYLARTALLKNNPKLAVQLTKQAVDIDSAINLSHWYSGLSYIANGQTNEGVEEIKKALELGYKPQNAAEEAFIKNVGL